MTITEFAESRNVEPQAVSRFLIRHPEQKQTCTKVGKNIELSDEAYQLLDKQYPLPKPIHVINGVAPEEYEKALNDNIALHEDLENAKNLIISLKDQLTDFQLKLKDAETEQLRIEEKGKIKDTLIEKLEKSAEEQKNKSAEQELKLSDLQTQVETLKEELETEKNKSWWAKLLRK